MDTKKLNGIWRCMKYRCHSKSPNNPYAKNYRDRGITVCEEWRESFEAFSEWALANGYQVGLTIDRINADGNYEPANCRWVTASENSKGSRGTKGLKIETKTAKTEKAPERKGQFTTEGMIKAMLKALPYMGERELAHATGYFTGIYEICEAKGITPDEIE